jgi:threonine synthase
METHMRARTNSRVSQLRTNSRVSQQCGWCAAPQDTAVGRCECGGAVETIVDPSGQPPDGVSGFYRTYWSVLPLTDPRLPSLDLETPLVPGAFVQQLIGGPSVHFKLEALAPTGSTKDRAAAVALPYLREAGATDIVMSSTGNTSTAFAVAMQYFPDVNLHIFVGVDFAHRLAALASENVKVTVVDGNFVAAGAAAHDFARAGRATWEGGFFNPGRRDGLKTTIIEASMQLGEAPGTYVQAVSSAMGVVGMAKAARELSLFGFEPRDPVLICVQQERCAPMVSAWNAGRLTIETDDIVQEPDGIAKAILRGDPTNSYPVIARLVRRSNGSFVSVTDDEIIAARRLISSHLGISACEASAAALAGYLKSATSGITMPGPVLINITGADRNEIAV